MTTTNRRSFLRNALAAVCAAPLLVRAAFTARPAAPLVRDDAIDPALTKRVWESSPFARELSGAAIKVPSNRHPCYDYVSTGGAQPFMIHYEGNWDGTFKLEPCDNAAYVLADLLERSGQEPNWQELYRWGRFCDEPVIDWNNGAPQIDPPKWEPRFECNAALGSVAEQQRLKDTLASVERAWRTAAQISP